MATVNTAVMMTRKTALTAAYTSCSTRAQTLAEGLSCWNRLAGHSAQQYQKQQLMIHWSRGLLGELSRVSVGGLVSPDMLPCSNLESSASNTGDGTVELRFSVTDLSPGTCLESVQMYGL